LEIIFENDEENNFQENTTFFANNDDSNEESFEFGKKLVDTNQISITEIPISQTPLKSNVLYHEECILFGMNQPTNVHNKDDTNNEKYGNWKENKNIDLEEGFFNAINISQNKDIAFLPFIPIFKPCKLSTDNKINTSNPLNKTPKSKSSILTKFPKRVEKKHTKYPKSHHYNHCINNLQCESPSSQNFHQNGIKQNKSYKKNTERNHQIKNENCNDYNERKNKKHVSTPSQNVNTWKTTVDTFDLLSVPLKSEPIIISS